MRPVLVFLVAVTTNGLLYAAQPAAWTAPHEPFRIFGNTYYVGTEGLASVLIVTPQGHALIDGGVRDAAPLVAANITRLGFRLDEIKAIVASHAHHDHVGGIAALRSLTGARVYARAAQAITLQAGELQPDDPQYGVMDSGFPPVAEVAVIPDDGVVAAGTVALHVIATPGHTPGGTSWTWLSCEAERCINMVYGDSFSAVAADGFRYSDNAHPHLIKDFTASIDRFANIPCDVLMTPHPEQSQFFERMQTRVSEDPARVIDTAACKRYAEAARAALAARVLRERDGAEK